MTAEDLRSIIVSGLACEHIELEGDGRHWQAVMPSSTWGQGSPSGLSNRKKWQYL